MRSSSRRRDPTFLHMAAFAALGGIGAIVVSIVVTVMSWRAGHPHSTFFFFSCWGMAALAGAVANIVVYFQSGDPPPKPPRGGQRVTQLRVLETRPAPQQTEQERKAA